MTRTVVWKFFATAMVMMVMVLGVSLMPENSAQAVACTSWSDNFNGGPQQTWWEMNGGESSTFNFQHNRYELHTERSADSTAYVASYVNSSGTDYVMQARVQRIDAGDKFVVLLVVRGDEGLKRGYVLGTTSDGGFLMLGRLQAGGAYVSLTPNVGAIFTPDDFQLKFAVSGNNFYGKVWSGDTEPANWQITGTDSTYISGVGGILLHKPSSPGLTAVQVAFDDVSLTCLPPRVTLTAAPSSIVADGTSTSTLTATVNDVDGAPVPNGTIVNFNNSTGTINNITTTVNGIATATLKSAISTETVVVDVSATANGFSDMIAVFFIPASGPSVIDYTTDTIDGIGTINTGATGGNVTIDATGSHTVTTALFDGNPGDPPNFNSSGNYYDVHINSDAGVNSISIQFSPATALTVIHYWTGTTWRTVSHQSFSDGIVTVTVNATTSPSLSELLGRFFGSGTPTPEPVPPVPPVASLISTMPTSHGSSIPSITPNAPPIAMANIVVQSASLSTREVAPGIPVTVTVGVTNRSIVNGNKKVTLYVNGQVESTQGVAVNGGGYSKLTFTVSRSEPGDYNVYVDGVPAGSFKVEMVTGNDSILIFSVAIIAIAFILGVVMLWRRKQSSY